jgi:ribosomal protein S11
LAKLEQKAPPKKAGIRVKKKITRTIPSGIAHVKATFNNTIIAITDLAGNVVSKQFPLENKEVNAASTGCAGLTPEAVEMAAGSV